MTIQEFLSLSYRELEKRTKVDKSNWSKYFNNKLSPSWKTLSEVAIKLDMNIADLIEAIELKRKKMLNIDVA